MILFDWFPVSSTGVVFFPRYQALVHSRAFACSPPRSFLFMLESYTSHANPRLNQIQLLRLLDLRCVKRDASKQSREPSHTQPTSPKVRNEWKDMDMHRKQKRSEKTENNSENSVKTMREHENTTPSKPSNVFRIHLTFCHISPISASGGDIQVLNGRQH